MLRALAALALAVPAAASPQEPAGDLPPDALPVGDDAPVPTTTVVAPRSAATGTRSEALVTVVTREELRRTGERSLPRALEAASGHRIWVQETNLGGGSPIVRGLVGNQVLVVIDGVRLNDATTRLGPNQSLNTIDPATVERVEIVRGPASVLWGSDAIGGAILIWTRDRAPAGDDPAAEGLQGAFGGDWRSSVDGGRGYGELSWANDRHGLFALGSGFDFADLESGGGTVDHTGYHGNGFFGVHRVELDDDLSLRTTASVHRDFDVPRTDRLIVGFGQTQPADEVFEFSLQERQRYVTALHGTGDNALFERFEARASYRRYVEERERRSTGSDTLRRERDEVETVGLGLDLQRTLGDRQLLTYGLDVERDGVDASRRDTDLGTGAVTPKEGAFAPDSRYVRSGVFVQDEIYDLGGLDWTVGARWSYYDFSFESFGTGEREDGSFDALTASVQAARQVAERARVTGTLAQGYRAPGLDDLAKNGGFAGGEELANPDLDPEESWTAELALDAWGERWDGGVAVFYTEVDDVIGRELVDEGDPTMVGDETYLRQNVGELELYGVEGYARHRLGGGPLWAAAAATLTRGRQFDDTLDPSDGETDARRIPPLFGRTALEYRPQEARGVLEWADLELVFADDQDHLNPQDVSDPRIDPDGTPGWGVVNVDVGGRIEEDLTWHVGLHNVLDKEYRVHASGFDAPGRTLVVGMEWRP